MRHCVARCPGWNRGRAGVLARAWPARNRQSGRDVAGPIDRAGPAARLVRAAEGDPGPARLHPGPDPAGPGADPVLAAAGKLLEAALVKVSSVASKLTT